MKGMMGSSVYLEEVDAAMCSNGQVRVLVS